MRTEGVIQYFMENKQEEPEVTKFDFTNTKINIKKYADEGGITLSEAISDYEKLVGKSLSIRIDIIEIVYLFSNTIVNDYSLGWGDESSYDYFNSRSEKEITLTRNVTITPSFVTPETVSLPDGRTVLKKDYDEALSKLKTFTGN